MVEETLKVSLHILRNWPENLPPSTISKLQSSRVMNLFKIDSVCSMLLEEPVSILPLLLTSSIKEVKKLTHGSLLLEKESALTPEDSTSNQVRIILFLGAGIKDMFLDKCGAVSVLTAFQGIVEEKLPINVTVSIGLVENSVAGNSYRPSDILVSRKGLTVEIGNTDAEGRLVLADCMNWTQEHYKTAVLIELSTLTGNIIAALGHRYAGLFTNDENLRNDLQRAGRQINEESWHMPISEVQREQVRPKIADLTNHSGKIEAGSSQAAAFLEAFVENGVKWIHLDVAGTAMVASEGTGFGTRLLIQYARNYTA